MLCDLTDGPVGEGRLMMIILRLIVDDEKAGDGAHSSYKVEDEGRKGTFEHV